jgi:uncharacterized protein YjiS (DUF1127 family)
MAAKQFCTHDQENRSLPMSNSLVKFAGPQRAIPPAHLTDPPVRTNTAVRTGARDGLRIRRASDEMWGKADAPALRVPKADAEALSLQHQAPAAVSADDGALSRYPAVLLSAVLGPFRAELRRLAERRALSRATSLLGSAPDSVLKDIGISRCEITYHVRHGRDCGEDWKAGPWF